MPDRRRVRWSQLKVGVMGITAFVIIFVLVLLLTSSKGLFRRSAILHTYMHDALGMTKGSSVRLNGIEIGYLDSVTLTNSPDPMRAVQFNMKVDPKFLKDIPVDSLATITAANLIGDKFIDITRGKDKRTVKDGSEITAQQGQDIPELMAQSAVLLDSFQSIINRIGGLLAYVEEGKGNIGLLLKDRELYDRANAIISEGQKLLNDVRTGNGSLSKVLYSDELYNEIRSPINRIDSILAGLQAGQGSAGRLLKDPALVDELQKTIADIHTLFTELNAGKGTAGQLLKNDQIAKQLEALTTKLNTTIDRINSGQGTVGQLLVNPSLYDALTGATREFQSMARDMRANPKKFLTIRLTLF
jgi:phospholipid/cholesterol/gamma-HCH transport system substrate-binding protein